ncbi:MAG TPA: hypothetical protein VFU35_05855 [Jatrophihabitans sp.]|nr:hypothetical protein [Jatrophihabitans sp.]
MLLLWPITRAGYLLGHDMVFTPRQPLDLASIGLSTASPRAVPLDALVALAERVIDGAVVGRIAVIVPLLAAGLGTAVLLAGCSLAARLAACGLAIWCPYLVERMALGQWALVWAYAALPWLVLAIRHGRGWPGWLWRALALAAAAVTPTGGLIGAATLITVTAVLGRSRRELAAACGLAVLLQLPWLVPALVGPADVVSDPLGVTVFAARAEHPGGAALSLLGGGGIWDAEVVPGSRNGPLAWLGLLLVVGAAWYGWRRLVQVLGKRLVAALAGLALAGLLLAVVSSLPGGDALMRTVVAHVPGTGLLRDAQKWVMPLVLLEALLAGTAIDRAARRLRSLPWRMVLLVGSLAVPIVVLPDAAATMRPSFEPVRYPGDWAHVVDRARGGEATVVPYASYRLFGWAPGRSVLDPAPRLLQLPTVVDDRLVVSGRRLRGEDSHARAVGAALRTGSARRLADLGVEWVVVEHGTPGDTPDLTELRLLYTGRDLSLYRVPGAIASRPVRTVQVVLVLVIDGLVVLALATLAGAALGSALRRPRVESS